MLPPSSPDNKLNAASTIEPLSRHDNRNTPLATRYYVLPSMPSTDEDAAVQLQTELQQSVNRSESSQRPTLTHLNADTSWLLSIPYRTASLAPPGRCRYNILIDPWFQGPQSDGPSWFSTQWHIIESSVKTIAELEGQLMTFENSQLSSSHSVTARNNERAVPSYIDAVVISHEFTDHCHKATLQEIHSGVPVFATTKAASLIGSWDHFDTVIDMPPFTERIDWHTTSISPLPPWLGVSRLTTAKDSLYYHSAVIICISTGRSDAEAVVYTPHGVEASSLSTLGSADPPVRTLAFMHGLHDVSLKFTKQLNLGVYNALQAQHILHSRYWVGTHDEVKKGGGIVAAMIRRKAYTIMDALSSESSNLSADKTVEIERLKKEVAFVDLKNGQSLILE